MLNSFIDGEKGEVHARVFGYDFALDLGDNIQRNIYLGTFEPRETRVLRRYLQPGMTFVDIGANVGYYSALAARAVGAGGKVIAFEPSTYVLARLERLVRENDLGCVTVVPHGLGDAEGEVDLFVPPTEVGNHAPTFLPNAKGTPVRAKVRTLDSVANELGLGHIDVVKIDVEGYEMRALKGASRLLREKRIGAILCEFNEFWLKKAGSSARELFSLLIDNGFRCDGPQPDFEKAGVVTLFFHR